MQPNPKVAGLEQISILRKTASQTGRLSSDFMSQPNSARVAQKGGGSTRSLQQGESRESRKPTVTQQGRQNRSTTRVAASGKTDGTCRDVVGRGQYTRSRRRPVYIDCLHSDPSCPYRYPRHEWKPSKVPRSSVLAGSGCGEWGTFLPRDASQSLFSEKRRAVFIVSTQDFRGLARM